MVPVEVLASIADGERLEHVLEGWRERCGEPRSLSWLRERAARLGSRVRVAHGRVAASVAGAGATLAAATSLALEVG